MTAPAPTTLHEDVKDNIGEPLADATIEVLAFRPASRMHARSAFVGYADIKLTIPACLPGGEDLTLGVKDFEVRLVGLHGARVDFRRLQAADGSDRWFPTGWPNSAATRQFLTRAIFSDARVMEVARPLWKQLQEKLAQNGLGI